MGMNVSCHYTTDDIDSRLESYLVRSSSFGDYGERQTYRSASFNGRDSKRMLSKSYSFKRRDHNNHNINNSNNNINNSKKEEVMLRSTSSNDEGDEIVRSPSHAWREVANRLIAEKHLSQQNSKRFMAAVRLQKTYKSFRTRRRLADCAVLVEQKWWKVLDFAELKRTSVSFFDIEKHETAISRWSRARTRAAKVGKGLSKDEKARKLALQHWLEAIDPRHRYGHNLQFYYVNWLQCESKQPFFYWLDVGEGKEVNLEKCLRSKLQHQCIKYLGPMERKKFEVIIEGGKLKYKEDGKILHTKDGPEDTKWIFVLSVSKTLYVGQKKKGRFQHSSFLAGGATLSAGRLVVEDGILQAVWPHSGHYLPTEENFEEFVLFLKEHDVDLSRVQKSPTDEDQEGGNKDSSKNDDTERLLRRASRFRPKIRSIKIPDRENLLEDLSREEEQRQQQEQQQVEETREYETADENLSDTDTEYSFSKHNLFDEDEDEEYEEIFLQEKIMERINSHKLTRSYQLAHQLSFRWTTGAGPRIGCVRDYPSELQFRALEEVHLSPRSLRYSSPRQYDRYSPRVGASSSNKETTIGKSPLASETL